LAPETVSRLPCCQWQAGQLLSSGRLYQLFRGLQCSLCRAGRCLEARGLVVKVGICTLNSFPPGEAIRCEQGRPCSHRTARMLLLGTVSLHTERRTSHAQLQWCSCFQTRDVRRDTRGALCVQADQCVRCPPRAPPAAHQLGRRACLGAPVRAPAPSAARGGMRACQGLLLFADTTGREHARPSVD